VILFPDTFNNFFRPGVAIAAVEVLEHVGYNVRLPDRLLCCGRPLYAEGMLTTARHLLGQILDTLGSIVSEDRPLVGLEPACVATFRDELVNMFPDDERAKRLAKNTYILSEFLAKEDVPLPSLAQKAKLHLHCNHHAMLDAEAEKKVLHRMNVDFETLDSGCCGMAGSFGFEEQHYDIAMACGERVLLPAVRNAPQETLIISCGFSCREQIAQATDRQALHLAEVIRMAQQEAGRTYVVPDPERYYLEFDGMQGRSRPSARSLPRPVREGVEIRAGRRIDLQDARDPAEPGIAGGVDDARCDPADLAGAEEMPFALDHDLERAFQHHVHVFGMRVVMDLAGAGILVQQVDMDIDLRGAGFAADQLDVGAAVEVQLPRRGIVDPDLEEFRAIHGAVSVKGVPLYPRAAD
jgi:hypothetical protein